MQVHPSFSVDKVEAEVDRYGYCGFKPYRLWAQHEDNCRIPDMIPDPLIELANDRHLIIMMHVGKWEGIADEQNIDDLLYLAGKYPTSAGILRIWPARRWPGRLSSPLIGSKTYPTSGTIVHRLPIRMSS